MRPKLFALVVADGHGRAGCRGPADGERRPHVRGLDRRGDDRDARLHVELEGADVAGRALGPGNVSLVGAAAAGGVGGHGIDGWQYVTNILVFFGLDWNLEYYQQMVERIGPVRQIQAGFDRNVFIYNIIARGTVDEDMILRRETKKSVQDILLEAMKHRRNR